MAAPPAPRSPLTVGHGVRGRSPQALPPPRPAHSGHAGLLRALRRHSPWPSPDTAPSWPAPQSSGSGYCSYARRACLGPRPVSPSLQSWEASCQSGRPPRCSSGEGDAGHPRHRAPLQPAGVGEGASGRRPQPQVPTSSLEPTQSKRHRPTTHSGNERTAAGATGWARSLVSRGHTSGWGPASTSGGASRPASSCAHGGGPGCTDPSAPGKGQAPCSASPQGRRVGDDQTPGVLPVLLTHAGKRTVACGVQTAAVTSSGGLGLSAGLGLMEAAESRLPARVSSACHAKGHTWSQMARRDKTRR